MKRERSKKRTYREREATATLRITHILPTLPCRSSLRRFFCFSLRSFSADCFEGSALHLFVFFSGRGVRDEKKDTQREKERGTSKGGIDGDREEEEGRECTGTAPPTLLQ